MTDQPHRTIDASRVVRLRQGLYRFFAAVFLYPDTTRLANLVVATPAFEGLEAFAFYAAWQRLSNALQELGDDDVVATEAAYNRLFSMRADGTLISPHASSYLASPGPATGLIIAQLEKEYARLGLALSREMRNSPDHVTVQMEVMAYLCTREARALETTAWPEVRQALKDQRALLSQHLGRWFPRFAKRLIALDPGGLYSLAGEAADAFIQHDQDFLALWLEVVQTENREGLYAKA